MIIGGFEFPNDRTLSFLHRFLSATLKVEEKGENPMKKLVKPCVCKCPSLSSQEPQNTKDDYNVL